VLQPIVQAGTICLVIGTVRYGTFSLAPAGLSSIASLSVRAVLSVAYYY